MKKIKVWTRSYRPFILGGDVNAPVASMVEAQGPFPLGKGYKGYLIVAPNGKTWVAESTTGALVGPTLDEVRADIKAAKPSVMKAQIEDAKIQVEKAYLVPAKEFWTKLKAL